MGVPGGSDQSLEIEQGAPPTQRMQSCDSSVDRFDRGAPSSRTVCSILCSIFIVAVGCGALIVELATGSSKNFTLDHPDNDDCGICGSKSILNNMSFVDPTKNQEIRCELAGFYCRDASKCGSDCGAIQDFFRRHTYCCEGNVPTTYVVQEPQLTPGNLAIAIQFGLERQQQLQSSILAGMALVAIVGSTFTSSLVVIFSPHLPPSDFEAKGTLSNVSQDVSKPHGRLFAVSLFMAALLEIFSMYTFWIYRNWIPRIDFAETPFYPPHSVFEGATERLWRTLWVIAPQMGLMFTATVPSLSDTTGAHGYNLALTLVHNVAAPLAIAFMLIMETVQLEYGELAFSHFFSSDGMPYWAGEITSYQRYRVVLALYAWTSILVFLGVQIYYGLGDVLGMSIRRNYSIALVSFFGEVIGMSLVFALPALAGVEIMRWNIAKGPVLDEARDSVIHGPWGPWPPINISTR